MLSLLASDVVRAWEAGRDRHPVDRALLLLALGYLDTAWEQLTGLSIGQRNGRLRNGPTMRLAGRGAAPGRPGGGGLLPALRLIQPGPLQPLSRRQPRRAAGCW